MCINLIEQTKRTIALFIGLIVALCIIVVTAQTGGDLGSTQTIILTVAGFFGATILVYLLLRTYVPTTAPKPARMRRRRPYQVRRIEEEEEEVMEEEEEVMEEPVDEEAVTPPPKRKPKRRPPTKEEEEPWDAMDFDV